MIFKIYLGVSILTLVTLALHNLSGINQAKRKFKKELEILEQQEDKHQRDISGVILAWLKMIIYSFIPILNITMLFLFLFCGNKIQTQTQEILNEAFKKRNNI